MKLANPKIFNPSSRAVIEETKQQLSLIINRKSRIIMKDGRRLLEQIKEIKKTTNKPVSIFTTAPVCSKTKKFLNNNKIEITVLRKTEKQTQKPRKLTAAEG